ncbi:Ltp family lipoprotein [Pseudactinotalea terrae]|uniref:Ltp family lipoprotein n=1 Tax=Pseudactinotalea terrae TaxID=1743262 RepID=UPI0019D5CAE5|nr:Ltp family lipoprotein [Pseudactinotalea terrae]
MGGVVGGLIVVGLIGNALGGADGDEDAVGQLPSDSSATERRDSSPDPSTPSQEPTTEEPVIEVVADDTYYSFADLQRAYVVAGGDCEDTKELPQPGLTALYQAECPDGSVLALFASEDDMLTQSATLMELAVQSDSFDGLLIASDMWTINPGDSVDVDEIVAVMGGVVITEADYAATGEDEATEAEPELTTSQQNAIGTARDYLDYTGFSRSGLIDQLEYEGYSTEDATFAVDYLDVDWIEQAVIVAENYIDYTGFSRSGLIDQLEYEGFSADEAEYGVSNITVDWNEQAAVVAQNYLDYSEFSRQELLDQLLYEGFTQEQAEFGLEAVGY